MLWWKIWTKNPQSCQYMYNQALLYLLFTALGKHSVSQFFQFFHPKRCYPYFVVGKSRVIALMDASPQSSPQLAPSPLSSQRSLCIVYRGTNIELLLAMAASSISLAKLSSSRMQKVSLHAWCPAPGTAGDRPSTNVYGWTKKWRLQNPLRWSAWCLVFQEVHFSWLKVDACWGHPLVLFSFTIMASSYHAFYWSVWALKFIIY